ncbi:collagen-like protein [Aurantibacter crassamenti]|uniref:collagen-like protein n=1 Tax=Aurantibacter crassamenti TaxID=1837375 RepID=UPI0019399795|nr:collagen-like protein [Aurantibacter crassamenti]MBM1105700.1 collagen-like protein [Aurantibacter crassamenti]
MKTKMKFMMSLIMVLSIAITSCSKEGDIGPAGVAGTNGADGTDGIDGVDGADGIDGVDGTDGVDGADGNANVETYVFDTSDVAGTIISLSVPAITQTVLDNDVILSYIAASNNFTYQTPGGGPTGDYITRAYEEVGNFYINFHNWDGTSYSIVAGDILAVKLIIIESSNTIAGKQSSSKQTVLNELANAGVDVDDYHAVLDYYELNN